jgi:ribonuclease BN (tRNA processing enzyme)
LNHPQGAIGLRFEEGPRTLVFITDNELDPQAEPPAELVRFCQGASVIIHDDQYLPEEMAQRKGWGHSDWRSCLKLARMAEVDRLILTHHDPSRTDAQVEKLSAEARKEAGPGLAVEAAYEGMVVEA